MASDVIRRVTVNVRSDYTIQQTIGELTLFVDELTNDIAITMPPVASEIVIDVLKIASDGYECTLSLNPSDAVTGTLATLETNGDCLKLSGNSPLDRWENKFVKGLL